jgi:hypothetical protein
MGIIVIKDSKSFTSKFETKELIDLNISEKSGNIEINNTTHSTSRIATSDYPIIDIDNNGLNIDLIYTLPFRIKLTNIGIEGYGPNNPAPIGIAIIGLNNYIL